jgi:hypothetical protein
MAQASNCGDLLLKSGYRTHVKRRPRQLASYARSGSLSLPGRRLTACGSKGALEGIESRPAGPVIPSPLRNRSQRGAKAIEVNRAAISRARPAGFVLGALAVGAIGITAGSVATVVYALLGGGALGIWPGIAANFLRLWREKWSKS